MRKKWRYVLLCLVVLWACNKLFLIYTNKTYTSEEISTFFEPLTSKYGIKIVYDIGEDFFSPLEKSLLPAGPSKHSKVEPIRHRVMVRYVDILKDALSRYPDRVIKNHLKAIHFAGKINEDGFEYGGSYDPYRRILYIVDGGYEKEGRPFYAIHHELSSLFLARHSLFINPWTDHNPKNFVYLYEKSDNKLKTYKTVSTNGSADDYEKGFMNTYGQTNFENDFNEYSAMIFTYPDKFKQLMERYPRVRGKFKVWLDFYQKIDPVFTETNLLGEG